MANIPDHDRLTLPEAAVTEITDLFDTAVAQHKTSGVTWAIVGGHATERPILAHGAAGDRELDSGEPTPGSTPMARDSISRIASMTKSFTAAALLALRDEGKLRLDDPVAAHVPEAADAFAGSEHAPVVTLRHLLTMSAGLVTDNPWGDRQESMTREQFAAILRAGLGQVHEPTTGFEYSNTGYALLGRVIDEVAREDHTAVIRRRFLEPLGLTDTAFETPGLDSGRLATGHRLGDRSDATRFEAVPFDSPGVYGAMAGLYSTIDDVATWMRFLAAADAPAGDPPASASPERPPLSIASRREMQQLHRHQKLRPRPAGDDGVSPGFDRIRGYGYGLVVEQFPDLGEVISHSGGYPGYGSFMIWHRDSGVGVVALANSKYAPVTPLSMQALRVLLRVDPALLITRDAVAAPRTARAAEAALDWLRGMGDAFADEWFADNMDLDISRPERRRRLESALETAGLDKGALGQLTAEDALVLSPAHLRWTLPGVQPDETPQGGSEDTPASVRIDLLMDPRRDALIQGLDVTSMPPKRR